MHKIIVALALVLFILPVAPTTAEIYKYVDENGQKRWTDDLSQVPKAQRPSVQRVETSEAPDAAPVTDQTAEKDAAQSESNPEKPAAIADDPSPAVELNRDILQKEKADLDNQYRQLMEERKQLEDLRTGTLDAKARERLNQRVAAYNKKAEAYEKRLETFNKNVEQFNRQHGAAPKAEATQ